MKSKKPLPAIVVLAILTAITTVIWVGFEVYRAYTKKPAETVPPEITNVLSPTLDLEALSRVEQSIYLTDEEIGTTEIVSPITAEETPEPVVEDALPPSQAGEGTVVENGVQ